jgi:hypothetical protein
MSDDGGLHLQNKHLIKKNNKTPCVVIGLTNGVVIGLTNGVVIGLINGVVIGLINGIPSLHVY